MRPRRHRPRRRDRAAARGRYVPRLGDARRRTERRRRLPFGRPRRPAAAAAAAAAAADLFRIGGAVFCGRASSSPVGRVAAAVGARPHLAQRVGSRPAAGRTHGRALGVQLGAAVGGAVGGLRLRRRRRLRGLLALLVGVVVVADPHLAPLVACDLRRWRRRDLRRRRHWLGDVVFDRLRAAAARAPLDEEVGGAGPRTLRLRRRRRDARWGLRRLARRQRAARRWRGRRGNRECRGGCSDGTWPGWARAGAERCVGSSGVEGAGAGGGIAGRGARLSVDIDASGAASVAPSCTPSSAAAPATGTAASTGCVACVAIFTASSILRKARRGGAEPLSRQK